MPVEIPQNNPEKKETLDDNARKFIVDSIDPTFLRDQHAVAHNLTVDWLETSVDNEKKVAYKRFDSGEVQILFIAKVTKDGDRKAVKNNVTEEEYTELITGSLLHLDKRRYECEYLQNGMPFSIKYDEFSNSTLRILEVDASTDDQRDSFTPSHFPGNVIEVTGDMRYYGYRVVDML